MEVVFVNDKPILFSDDMVSYPGYDVYTYKDLRIAEVLHKLRHSSLEGVLLFHNDLEALKQTFVDYFYLVTAAGGLVKDEQNHFMFIHRNNRWDLPKGHMEVGESPEQTAVREVEEECGVQDLEILNFIKPTYHIYRENQSEKLKKTYWYAMQVHGRTQPKPQVEEGITEVVFKRKYEIVDLFPSMYHNVRDLVSNFLAIP